MNYLLIRDLERKSRVFSNSCLCMFSPRVGLVRTWGGVAPWQWRYIVRRKVRGPVGGSFYRVIVREALTCAGLYWYSFRAFVSKFIYISRGEGRSWCGSTNMGPAQDRVIYVFPPISLLLIGCSRITRLVSGQSRILWSLLTNHISVLGAAYRKSLSFPIICLYLA